METMTDFIFLGSKILWTVTAAMKLKDTCSLEGKLDKTKKHRKKTETSLCQQSSA